MGPRSGSTREVPSARTDGTGPPITIVILGGAPPEADEPEPPTGAAIGVGETVRVVHGRAADGPRRRAPRLVGAVAAALLVVVAAALASGSGSRSGSGSSHSSRDLAADPVLTDAQLAERLLADAADPAQEWDVALLLAAEAWRRDPSLATRTGLLDALTGAGPWSISGGAAATGLASGLSEPIVSADRRWMLIRRPDGEVERRSTAEPDRAGTQLPDLTEAGGTHPVAIDADGSRALLRSAGDDGRLFAVDIDTVGAPIVLWHDAIGLLAADGSFHADGRAVVAYGRDRSEIHRVDVDTGRSTAWQVLAHLLPGSSAPLGHPRFTDDGRFVDVTLSGSVARLEADDLQVAAQVDVPFPLTADSITVPGTWSVVVGGEAGRLGRWNLATDRLEASGGTPAGEPVTALVLAGDDTVVARVSGGNRVGLFDASTLGSLGTPLPVHGAASSPLALAPDGGSLLVVDADGTHRAWAVTGKTWFAAACEAAGRDLTEAEWGRHVGDHEQRRPTCPR